MTIPILDTRTPPRSAFNPANWQGALPDPFHGEASQVFETNSPFEDIPLYCWFRYCLPTFNQKGPSCVGQGWANWLELMIRRYISPQAFRLGEQISGEMIHAKGRDMFWNGDQDGGLLLPQGFEAMKALGLIPDGSKLFAIKPDWRSRAAVLAVTPLVQGHHVHAGWADPDPKSGCIDHAPVPTDADGYHCTLQIGQLVQEETKYNVSQNSWGPDWAWHGLFLMTEAEDKATRMPDGPYTIVLPDGWRSFDGWRKGVVRC